jgi:hypothetical protein
MEKSRFMYLVRVSKGYPIMIKTLNELGQEGWCLAGVVKMTAYSDAIDELPEQYEEFWYYFTKEARNV